MNEVHRNTTHTLNKIRNKNNLTVLVSAHMLRAHSNASRTSWKWSRPPSPETNSADYNQENEARYNEFRAKWITRMKILYPSIPGRDLNIMVFNQDVTLDGVVNINPTYLLLSMQYRSKPPGLVCQQWFASRLNQKHNIFNFKYDEDKLNLFRDAAEGRLRVIVLLDDHLFHKDSAFFTRNVCNFCERARSHMTWVCPLYPTEEMRAAHLRLTDRCTGCGQPGCHIGRNHHENRIDGGCRQCLRANDHVGWRCASFTRQPQMDDQTSRYLMFLHATLKWPDIYFENLLRNVCEYYVLPYPEDIFNA